MSSSHPPQPPNLPSTPASSSSSQFTIHTTLLFCPLTKTFKRNLSLTISPVTGLITHIRTRPSASPSSLDLSPSPTSSSSSSSTYTLSPNDLDLTSYPLLLPGFCDLHTHLLLHPYTSSPSLSQILFESPIERILRASIHARAALNAGWTTYRDLGTESLGDADVHIRNAINRGIIPGPRAFVATEAIATSGGYAVRSENDATLGNTGSVSCGAAIGATGAGIAGPGSSGTWGTLVPPRLSDAADGEVGLRAAVRRRLAAGADLIKIYVDYRSRALRWPGTVANTGGGGKDGAERIDIRFPPEKGRNPNVVFWTQGELNALVDEARKMGAGVAAHASSARGVFMAAKAGCVSVEHGFEDEEVERGWNGFLGEEEGKSESGYLEDDEALREMVRWGTLWVPTLSVAEALLGRDEFERVVQRVKRGVEMGVRIGVGGDTGAGTAHGVEGAREVELLVEKVGMRVEDVLRSVTLGGWEGVWGREIVDVDGKGEGLGGVIGRKKQKEKGQEQKVEGRKEKKREWEWRNVRRFGAIREGWVADFVGIKEGDIREDITAIRNVGFVMKDGEVVRWDENGIRV